MTLTTHPFEGQSRIYICLKIHLIVMFYFFLCTCTSIAAEKPTCRFDAASLPAVGRQETILHIPAFGRYAVYVKSPSGTAVQLIDRLSGPTEISGRIGETDGRLDLFLDRGTYKVVVLSHEKGTGQAALFVQYFEEKNKDPQPVLEDLKIITSEVDDFQQSSFWLDIKKRRTVMIEAAGRNLADLRLWKEGGWLVDADPVEEVIEPRQGEPLLALRLVADLNPGLYRLSAYGGITRPWADTSDAHPLFIRKGIPELSVAGRQRYTASVFGIDRFVVPEKTNFFRLELPKAETASLRVTNFQENNPYSRSGVLRKITKKSLPPAAEIMSSRYDQGRHVITITRETGKPYTLQYFEYGNEYSFSGNGNYWISTIHSGHGGDVVDATAILTSQKRRSREKETLYKKSVVLLNQEQGWHRKFNLIEPLTLFLEVADSGKYRVTGKDAKAKFRLEPFLINRPQNYRIPDFKSSGESWDLQKGFYVLTAEPMNKGKGILDLDIQPENKGKIKTGPPLYSARFPGVSLERNTTYRLYMNRQPGVKSGVILRELPVDLSMSLPVTQNSGETLTVPVKIPETGRLTAISEDGTLLNLSVRKFGSQYINRIAEFVDQFTDVDEWEKAHALSPGEYLVKVENTGNTAVRYAITLIPERLETSTPLPSISQEAIRKLPEFPVLDIQPVFFDIGRQEKKTFLVNVTEPSLYCLESTGLLETEGMLRTRTNPSLDRGYNNGIGRNFMVQQYLREGNYQLTIMSKGESEGHLGARIRSTKLNQGGMLTSDIPSRYSLKANEGLVYRFEIQETNTFHLEAMGLERNFQIRLEDAGGWPLLQPGIYTPLQRELRAGEYRIIILPRNVDSRVVTLLKPAAGEVRFSGHGPHRIAAENHGRDLSHIWHEPETGEPRIPDRWCFTAPSAVDAVIRLSHEMTGTLYQVSTFPENAETATAGIVKFPLTPRKVWQGRIEKGNYCLDVTSIRKNNRLGYTLNIDFQQLTTGHGRRVSVPAKIPVSVGADSSVDLFSFGNKDVRATLYNETGERVAQNDDRNDDWNFLISGTLKSGMYYLDVTPVAVDQAETAIYMQSPEEIKEQPLKLPANLMLHAKGLHSYPLILPTGSDVVVVSAESDENIRIAVERKDNGIWHPMGTDIGKAPLLAVVLSQPKQSSSASFRLRVQSADQRPAGINIHAAAISPKPVREDVLTGQGALLEPLKNFMPKVGIACVDLTAPGLFHLENASNALYAVEKHAAFISAEDDFMIAGTTRTWIMDKLEKDDKIRVKAARVHLGNKNLNLTIPSHGKKTFVGLTADKKGPLLVHITSRVDQPGIAISDAAGAMDFNPYKMGISRKSAVAVALDLETPVACMWHAGNTPYPLPVEIRQINFPEPVDQKVRPGITDLALEPNQAFRLQLPGGLKQIQIILPAETAAVLTGKGKTLGVHWSGNTDITRLMESDADTMLLLHTGKQRTSAGVIVTSVDAGIRLPVLSSSILFKSHFPKSGSIQLKIFLSTQEKATGVHLKLYGKDLQATLITRQGKIEDGSRFLLKDDASVIIRHAPGLILAWLEGGDNDPFRMISGKQVVKARPPVKMPLKGDAMTLDLDSHQETLALLKTDVPVIAYVRSGQRPAWVDVYPQGADMPVYISSENDKSGASVTLQPIDSGQLSGSVEILTTQATALGEGAGEPILLAPGDARLYSFSMNQKGTIGLGVRASSDIATCCLMDHTGKILGTGVVQMHDLDPGKYLMTVKTPSDGFPVEVQPVLVNIKEPDTGPPDEVIRKYLE